MKIIKQAEINIKEIVDELRQGKVIVYPTETCYGLGCDATNQKAVDKLFEIKKRQKDKTVLVLVSGLDVVRKYIELSPKIFELASKYWPGSLTVVAPVVYKDGLADGVVGSDNTMALRVTSHHLAHQLCKELGVPLVSTSANIATLESPYDIGSILSMYESEDKKPDIVIDGGTLPHRNTSTIIKVDKDNFEVLRQGDLIVEV
ncbi:MAG: threonylcarbamoyl-AMP synthase [Candidatus Magasanikbacteria bacterium RIFCSPHIGHO2_01_FULL_33_34]|uniref:L-threonylcarbamoyladenylate synthase n=1 Tax=Candidatus Magasanikbacteria bacterium RIFCSPHIGHO2_01_FULL_33_34 TaxID=1798671 RepID=A0A1F6LK60_9BACT|nr:MAG: threonylcarbamoyl-AMP synthase [Candidatus Magasanikbacteria bacterium RIFCSPHIGHO2_01_FULL_33_34]OGH65555.1 MAG: threonylcarbamoyl-AMP synthase [Candidatus Magasanikbacteria bacterium RIFCSPHIGHO2_02_FULL_33_17]OGH76265.1 MAG: threonylcarbamoyl-AMP synthase [Candidatus Magasanikbacteria bacterium RIFCSPLOWO2_01_FULL_33_34]OGH81116.1 MAG: threonylcarbamoyl-AMP synthase [Candidatus Magasanikbacteria bacterium RIFCSPLOWO2_12_FULL_34_7]